MKNIEKILAISAIIAFVLKLNNISIGSLILTTTIGSLACFYIYLGSSLYEDKKTTDISLKTIFHELKGPKMSMPTLVSYPISIILIGILFNLQHWPGGIAMLTFGLVGALVALFVVGVKYKKNPTMPHKNMLIRLSIIGSIGLIIFILNEPLIK